MIEQITYLLFIKRLDELHTLAENKANTLGAPIENPVFPEGTDDSARRPRPYSDLRWSKFHNFSAQEMYEVIDQNVFPFIRGLGEAGSSFAANMKDARFTIPTRRCCRRSWICSKTSPCTTATPRATFTSTC